MFGNVRAYEGCALFRESIAKHPKFREWYERMKIEVAKGYTEPEKKSNFLFFLKSLDYQEEKEEEEKQALPPPPPPHTPTHTHHKSSKKEHKKEAKETKETKEVQTDDLKKSSKVVKDPSELTIFRVLTVTYMVHLIVFTYAGWMGR